MEKRKNSPYVNPLNYTVNGILTQPRNINSRTELQYEKGKQVVEIDSPSFLGGNGNRPMAYCIAGITSYFVATFVTVASSKGIRLSKLNRNHIKF